MPWSPTIFVCANKQSRAPFCPHLVDLWSTDLGFVESFRGPVFGWFWEFWLSGIKMHPEVLNHYPPLGDIVHHPDLLTPKNPTPPTRAAAENFFVAYQTQVGPGFLVTKIFSQKSRKNHTFLGVEKSTFSRKHFSSVRIFFETFQVNLGIRRWFKSIIILVHCKILSMLFFLPLEAYFLLKIICFAFFITKNNVFLTAFPSKILQNSRLRRGTLFVITNTVFP